MLCSDRQLSNSLCSWTALWSRDLAEKCDLDHLHISAGLKSFMKVATCGCHIFSQLHLCMCARAWGKHVMYLLVQVLMVLLFSLRWDWFLLWLQAARSEDGWLPSVHRALQVRDLPIDQNQVKLRNKQNLSMSATSGVLEGTKKSHTSQVIETTWWKQGVKV